MIFESVNWFDKFRPGEFSLKDEQRSGRPNDRHVTVREIEEMLKVPKSAIDRHTQRLRRVKDC